MSLWTLFNLWKDGKVDREDLMKNSLTMLRLHLIYRPKNEEMKPGKFYWIKFCVGLCSGFVFLTTNITTLYCAASYSSWELFKEYLAYFTSFVGCFYLYIMGSASAKNLHIAFTELHDFSEFGESDEVKTGAWFLNNFCFIQYMYLNSICIAHGIKSLFKMVECEENGRALGWKLTCSFFDIMPAIVNGVANKSLLFIWQMVTSFFISQGGGLCSFIFYEANQYLIVKIRHLNREFRLVFDEETDKRYNEKFRHCARYQAHIFSVARKLNASFRNIMFVHVLLAAAIFGLLANLILEKHSLPNILHLGAWVYGGFMACYTGQLTLNESDEITGAIYNSRWYEMDVSLQKDVLIALTMAKRPISMYAGPLGVLCFPLWIVIVKTAYSYMALVQTT